MLGSSCAVLLCRRRPFAISSTRSISLVSVLRVRLCVCVLLEPFSALPVFPCTCRTPFERACVCVDRTKAIDFLFTISCLFCRAVCTNLCKQYQSTRYLQRESSSSVKDLRRLLNRTLPRIVARKCSKEASLKRGGECNAVAVSRRSAGGVCSANE